MATGVQGVANWIRATLVREVNKDLKNIGKVLTQAEVDVSNAVSHAGGQAANAVSDAGKSASDAYHSVTKSLGF